MTFSPVEFAAAFERLRAHLGGGDIDDSSLLQLLDFWPKLAPLTKNPAYSSYVVEYLAFLEAALTEDNLRDLSLTELAGLESLGNDVGVREALLKLIRKQTARQHFYVGKLSEGLAECIRITREDAANETRNGSVGGLSEFETFHAFVKAFDEKWPATRKLLQELADEWQSEREFVSTDRIYCLFVQNNGIGQRSRGKLRALTGSVEERGRSAQNDEITFDNQLRASDDPIVGVAYQAMAATRQYLKSIGYSRLGASFYHAHFSVTDKRAVYTGDSIGVATALLAYAQLLHTEALRHDHLLPGDVACTGGIDEAGKITPVNGGSIHAKVERAFFSHIKYLVLPFENQATARQHLDALQSRFPARQLILLPAASFSSVVNDHNIIRPERVCIGEFVAKQAVKYSRMAKVQVPIILLVSAYLLACLANPKFWVGFDWNPKDLKFKNEQVSAYNKYGQYLWTYTFPNSIEWANETWRIADINGDGENEVLILPYRLGYSEVNGRLFVFKSSGDTLFTRDCMVRDVDPYGLRLDADSIATEGGGLYVGTYKGKKIITTCVSAQQPGRGHIRFWDSSGHPLGKYLNPGYAFQIYMEDFDGDGVEEALFKGTNNPLDCTSLFVLDPMSADGMSPPYADETNKIHAKAYTPGQRGNQKHMMFLPPSRMISLYGSLPYQSQDLFRKLPDGRIHLSLNEGTNDHPLRIDYIVDRSFRVEEVIAEDNFRAKYELAVSDGDLPDIPLDAFMDSVRFRVTYYINGEYVTEGQRLKSELLPDSSN